MNVPSFERNGPTMTAARRGVVGICQRTKNIGKSVLLTRRRSAAAARAGRIGLLEETNDRTARADSPFEAHRNPQLADRSRTGASRTTVQVARVRSRRAGLRL